MREGPNLRLLFDAARLLLHVDQWEIDGWWSKPVLDLPGVFDDKPDPDKALWVCTQSIRLPSCPRETLTSITLATRTRRPCTSKEKGLRFATRWEHGFGGRPFRWSTTSNTTGNSERSGRAISRRGLLTRSATTSVTCQSKPGLGLRFDFTSGSNSSNSSTLGTFNPLFPSGVYFNLLNPVGPLNLIDLHPTLDSVRQRDRHTDGGLGLLPA